jgi:2-dehydro-3-deoxy-D-arabinonate dehydratase
MRLYRLETGVLLERDGTFATLDERWDALINRDDLVGYLRGAAGPVAGVSGRPLPPIVSQEVWAAGVTYFRSRSARIEESKASGGGSFYDAVYSAARPELFFKAAGWRVRGTGDPVCIRRDARWSVPEPELALVINHRGGIVGYTIGNDMSSRDIEGENPLYLPQAKVYAECCGLGPALYVTAAPLDPTTEIRIEVRRGGQAAFAGQCELSSMKRRPAELVEYLFRDNVFPDGCFLLTGTGIVPPDDFTLQPGDEVRITIDPIGTLTNTIVQGAQPR